MKRHLIIRKLDYLKTPLFDWTIYNESGGSFSNSGPHRSLKACLRHALTNAGLTNNDLDLPTYIDVYYGWDEQEHMVKTRTQSYLAKLMTPEERGQSL